MASKAKWNFNPEDLVYSGLPYVQVVKKGCDRCENCCRIFLTLKRCKNCKFARYCDETCQKAAWPVHKLECKLLKNFPKCREPEFIRMISLLMMKLKGKRWEDVYENVHGEKVSFADMLSYFKEMTEDKRVLLYYKETCAVLKKYMGAENMPCQEKQYEIIGKVFSNVICLGKDGRSQTVIALYLGAANIHHSCIPNVECFSDDRILLIRSIAKIRKNNKFTMSKQNYIFMFCAEKVSWNPAYWCKCNDCSKPYGESLLTKVLDETAAFSAIYDTEQFFRKYFHITDDAKLLPDCIDEVNALLDKQNGVLGNTHYLRLRLLAFKFLFVEMRPNEKLKTLDTLAGYAKEVFGEYLKEVKRIQIMRNELQRLIQGFKYMPDLLHALLMDQILSSFNHLRSSSDEDEILKFSDDTESSDSD